VKVAAVMVPPMTMPNTATRVRTSRVRVGSPTMMPMVIAAPTPQDTTTAMVAPGRSRRRRVAVAVATVNMTATTAIEVAGAANTPRSAAAINVSCTPARMATSRTARRCPTPCHRQSREGDSRQQGQADPEAHIGTHKVILAALTDTPHALVGLVGAVRRAGGLLLAVDGPRNGCDAFGAVRAYWVMGSTASPSRGRPA